MLKKSFNKYSTGDAAIREALKKELARKHASDRELRIIEEFGVRHGVARIDIAVVNGVLHGYEIKSDLDTLERLPEQMHEYNSVFDQVTLVVGKKHIYHAINVVPEWWGITIAKVNTDNSVVFNHIRDAQDNKERENVSIARLLWREEALQMLEEQNEAVGYRSKPRSFIYEKLANVLDQDTLRKEVRKILLSSREGWRPDSLQVLNGG